MMKVRPGHGMEDYGISLLKVLFVVFSEAAEGVQICQVPDPIIEGATG